MKKLIFFATTIYILFSCNNKSSTETNFTTIEYTQDSIIIELGTNEVNNTELTQYFSVNDSDYLAILNINYNAIDIYNLDKRKLLKKVRIEEEGINAFPGKFGFVVKNLDTIILISNWPPSVALINREGTIVKKITFDKIENGSFVPLAIPVMGLHGIITGNVLHIVNELAVRQYTGKFTLADNQALRISSSIDLENGNVRLAPVNYPEKLIGKDIFNLSKCWEKGYLDCFVFSFSIFSDLFVTQDFTTFKVIPLETNYQMKLPENMYKYATDLHGFLNYERTTDAIRDIHYDPYREYYYIVVRKREEEIRDKEFSLKNTLYPDCFIIILDKSFKHLGDAHFPKGIYYFNNMFVNKEGLYISEDHVDNPTYSEDAMRFRLFKLKTGR